MAKQFKKTERNALGRTPKEQQAFDKLTETLTQILAGEKRVSATGYMSSAINVGTGMPFTGGNALTALLATVEKGDRRFIGAKEAISRGYNIKGASAVFFIRPVTVKSEDENGDEKSRAFFKLYPLLNLADIEHDLDDEAEMQPSNDCMNVVTELLEAADKTGNLTRNATLAHIRPTTNTINIPPRSQFFSDRLMASTVTHELAHFVAIDQKTVQEYEKYRGYEELCAEITSLLYCAQQGLAFEAKNAAYVNSWLESAKTTHTDPLKDAMFEAARRCELISKLVTNSKATKKAA